LIPDSTPLTMRARKSLSEAIAINAAAHVRKQQWIDLRTALETQVDRDPDLLSIGIRSDLGQLRVDTGHHEEMWPATEEQSSKVDAITVPITLNRRPWGQVELCFRQPHATMFATVMHHPLVRLLAFFMICGVGAYTIFVVRILRLFNSTQVVPDRVRQALDTLAEGLLVLDENGRIVLANRAFAEIVGGSADELTSKLASELNWVADDVRDNDYPWTLAIKQSELQTERILRYQLQTGPQRIFSVNAAPLGKEGTQRGALATFRDVTHVEEHRAELERMLSLLRNSRDEIKRKNSELEILATQDALTGCLNRRAFFESFESLWSESKAIDKPLSCLMIDIDHFKSVNDTYGHHTGDEVLRQVSRVIREIHKDSGLVCRYGGEEFCVLLPQAGLNQAIAEAERTREEIARIRLLHPADLRLTASLGVSEMRFEPTDPQDLINQADTCLYVAKREGRNRVVSYNAGVAKQAAKSQAAKEAKDKRVEIPYQAVTALVSALSYRDANTAEHSRRVADLCARVSDGLLDPAEIYVLEIAALLHDIGKIGVPDEILLKPGPLTRDEWELMGRHDRIGAEIIASAFDCGPLSEIISNHHAFFGGSGRDPHLPVGDNIPLGARLLTIADSYDAMVSDRVYRKGRSHEAAIAELRRCAGTQFDPKLVERFTQRISSQNSAVVAGAQSVGKHTAIQIGYQVERLAMAVSNQDVDGLKSLASHLRRIARHSNIEAIAAAAERIEAEACSEDLQWLTLLRDTHQLLDICRSTQSDFLRQSLESEAETVNR
jgi:diguanylate cyclase (GGDEF)-like protein/PAS domain S-box-containing protein